MTFAGHQGFSAVTFPPASQRVWTLPTNGLALFHGHPQTPKMFHYFLPSLICKGKQILCLDGANRFDPLLIARFARQWRKDPAEFNRRLRVGRAFTCFQLTELLSRAPRLLRDFSANVLIVTALPDLYFDEDVREQDAAASFGKALESLRTLKLCPIAVAVFSDASSCRTPRRFLFQRLMTQADYVWKFCEREDGRLALASEKGPAHPKNALP